VRSSSHDVPRIGTTSQKIGTFTATGNGVMIRSTPTSATTVSLRSTLSRDATLGRGVGGVRGGGVRGGGVRGGGVRGGGVRGGGVSGGDVRGGGVHGGGVRAGGVQGGGMCDDGMRGTGTSGLVASSVNSTVCADGRASTARACAASSPALAPVRRVLVHRDVKPSTALMPRSPLGGVYG
jgi:hypothetical protein